MIRFPAYAVFAAVAIAAAFSICIGLGIAGQEPPQAAADARILAADRNIAAAVELLQAYIQDNPNGKDAAVARSQLAGLKSLSPSSGGVLPVALGAREEGLQWYVAGVDARPECTVVTLKVINADPKRERGMFSFDTEPLAMFDNNWGFYPMVAPPMLPPGVRVQPWGQTRTMWWFQPQRVLTLQVGFAPLAPDAVGGRIVYRQDPSRGETAPAEFSLLNKKQTVQ